VSSDVFSGTAAPATDPLLNRLRLATAGSYDVAGELGRGGMAVVFLGKDLKLDRLVAIKVMDPRLSLTPGMAERFLQEARIAARLQHPHIIVVHDIREDHELIFFVMSFVEGAALDDLCRRPEPMPIDQARWILLQAARALAHAHAEGVVHRDVKPANIMVNPKGDVVLTDFGIAKAIGGTALTKSGTQIGTPVYMSPEQFSDKAVGPASDQYALGVTAYQLLTGQPPFTGELYRLIAAHGNEAPVPLRERRPDCPAFLANAVMRMLAKQPEERWPSLDDVAEVFGANLPMDGGPARRQLALAAAEIQRERAQVVPALSARTPVSPVPVGPARTPTPTPRVMAPVVTLSPPGATIFAGGAIELGVRVMSAQGEPVTGVSLLWSSSNPAVATVGGDGIVRGVGAGTAQVQVTANGTTAAATITVALAPLTRLVLDPVPEPLRIGDRETLVATVFDATGQVRHEVPVQWRVIEGADIVRVDEAGVLEALARGDALVNAQAGPLQVDVALRVEARPVVVLRLVPLTGPLELGAAVPLQAVCLDDRGTAAVHPVRWRSRSAGIVHVDANGVALAIAPGQAVIEAEAAGCTATLVVDSVEAPIAALAFGTPTLSVDVGEILPLPLRVTDASGAPRSAHGVTFLCDKPQCLAIDGERLQATGLASGVVRVIAAVEGSLTPESSAAPRATCTVTVRPVLAVALDVEPAVIDVRGQARVRVAVTPRDTRGRDVAALAIRAETRAPDVATVRTIGPRAFEVSGVADGQTLLRVQATNVDGSVLAVEIPLRVSGAPVTSSPVTDGPEMRAPSTTARPLTVTGGGARSLESTWSSDPRSSVAAAPVAASASSVAPAAPWRRVGPFVGVGAVLAVTVVWLLRPSAPPDVTNTMAETAPVVIANPARPLPSSSAAAVSAREPVTARREPAPPAAGAEGRAIPPSPRTASPPRAGTAVPRTTAGAPAAPAGSAVGPSSAAPSRPATATAPETVGTSTARPPERATESRSTEAAPAAPTMNDVRHVADSLVRDIRRGGSTSRDLVAFFKDGDGHAVKVPQPPYLQDESAGVVRAQIDLQLEKFDGGGRPWSRFAQLVFTISRREGAIVVQNVQLGPLQRIR